MERELETLARLARLGDEDRLGRVEKSAQSLYFNPPTYEMAGGRLYHLLGEMPDMTLNIRPGVGSSREDEIVLGKGVGAVSVKQTTGIDVGWRRITTTFDITGSQGKVSLEIRQPGILSLRRKKEASLVMDLVGFRFAMKVSLLWHFERLPQNLV